MTTLVPQEMVKPSLTMALRAMSAQQLIRAYSAVLWTPFTTSHVMDRQTAVRSKRTLCSTDKAFFLCLTYYL